MQKISQLENEKGTWTKRDIELSIQLEVLIRITKVQEEKDKALTEKLNETNKKITILETKLEFANDEKNSLRTENKGIIETLQLVTSEKISFEHEFHVKVFELIEKENKIGCLENKLETLNLELRSQVCEIELLAGTVTDQRSTTTN